MGFNKGMEILSILFRFQSRHGNPVKRNNDICLSSNDGMELLSPGRTNFLGCNEGMEILSTGNTDCLSSNDGMEIVLRGTTTVWVSMKAWKASQQETHLFGF